MFTVNETTPLLWDVLYQVRVKVLSTYTLHEIKEGIYKTTIDDIDKSYLNTITTVFLPIHRMAEIFHEGEPIAIVNKDDLLKIYRAIQNHLLAWEEFIKFGIHNAHAPIEDLLVFEEFAGFLYETIRRVDPMQKMDSIYGDRLKEAKKKFGIELFHPGLNHMTSGDPERKSLSDFLIDKYINK